MSRFVRAFLIAGLLASIAAPAIAHPDPSALARARAAEAKGDTNQALLLIQSAMVAHPADPENYIALADLYSRNGHPNAAVKYYSDALFIDPVNKEALKGIALADLALGDEAGAKTNLDLLASTCGLRCPETLAVQEALAKNKKPEAAASSAPLDKQ